MSATVGEITSLLSRWSAGDAKAFEALWPLVYDQLHGMAQRQLRQERSDHTLSATALIHEAYLRLFGQTAVNWQERGQFLCLAAQAMRRVLVDHARRRSAGKRPDPAARTSLDQLEGVAARDHELIAVDEALADLARLDPRQAQVVEMKFFGGLDLEEIGRALGISPSTVSRDWTLARAWLWRCIGPGG